VEAERLSSNGPTEKSTPTLKVLQQHIIGSTLGIELKA
jgi:hypothetical protein